MNSSVLKTFIARVKAVGLPFASQFFVYIPDIGTTGLLMMCDSTALPGQNILTTESRQFGELTEIPYGIIYPPVNMSFYLDNSMILKTEFDKWLNQVFNRETRSVGYYSDYTKQVDIFVTDKGGNVIYSQRLNECYPKFVGDIRLDYSATNVTLKLDVTLNYKWWNYNSTTSSGEPTGSVLKPVVSFPIGIIPGGTEVSGIITGITPTGIIPKGIGGGPIDLSGNLGEKISGFGESLSNVFSKAGSKFGAAFGASTIDSNLSSQMGFGGRSIGSNMAGMGGGLIELGKNILEYTGPLSSIGTSVTGLSGTLGAINGAMNTFGLGSPFTKTISDLNKAAGTIGQIANVGGLGGQLGNVGAVMTGAGAVFNSTVDKFKTVTGYNKQVESAINDMGSTFIDQGANLQATGGSLIYAFENGDFG